MTAPTPPTIQPGMVFWLHHSKQVVDAKKRFTVVVAVQPRVYCFVVQSELTDFQQKRPELRDSHIFWPADVFTFLKHDSYLNCTEVFLVEYTEAALIGALVADPSCHVATLGKGDLEQILNAVTKNRVLEGKFIRAIEQSLRPLI